MAGPLKYLSDKNGHSLMSRTGKISKVMKQSLYIQCKKSSLVSIVSLIVIIVQD